MKANNPDKMLCEDMGRLALDPLGWVMYAFDWAEDESLHVVKLKEPYRSRFGCEYGPDEWACKFLDELGEKIRNRGFDGRTAVDPIRESVVSGHGIGKSTLSSWLILFILSTRPFSKGVVTSNTYDQLKTKTWAELGKWHKKCITAHWFEYNGSKGNLNIYHKDYKESWRADAQTCKEENSEAFAGLHAATATPFYIFDEASAIPAPIYEVAEGGLTDGEPMQFLFGNPTRNSGKFFDSCNKLRHRYGVTKVDSRSVQITNKKLIAEWESDYGEDSDFFRVRVKGEFPRASSMQFISSEYLNTDQLNKDLYSHAPIVMGVDVARFGDDRSVITARQGLQQIFLKEYEKLDTMTFASIVAVNINKFKPARVFIDGGGVGGGVVDRLVSLGYQNIEDVNFGAKATEDKKYFNKRAEMWARTRDWMKDGGVYTS